MNCGDGGQHLENRLGGLVGNDDGGDVRSRWKVKKKSESETIKVTWTTGWKVSLESEAKK